MDFVPQIERGFIVILRRRFRFAFILALSFSI
jgi:hypothetical protein